MASKKPAALEPFKVVFDGGQFVIIAEELAARPCYVVMRRWNGVKQNWQRKAIGEIPLRDAKGRVTDAARTMVKEHCGDWYQRLTGKIVDVPVVEKHELSIGAAWDIVSNPNDGAYPHQTPYRDEMQRALDFASVVWGEATPWATITPDHWTRLLRARLTQLINQKKTGLRATEITIARLLTVVTVLRKKKRIPIEAALIDDEWRDAMRAFWRGEKGEASTPEPSRPRHTDAQARAIIAKSWDVDPRFGLMMALGAELRLGQVARARRSQLKLEEKTFQVFGAGAKQGETIDLTAGQMEAIERALTTYLAELELPYQGEGADYYLFPGGKLEGKKHGEPHAPARPIDETSYVIGNTIRKWYREAETLAKVPRIKGRGAYGVRRAAVDHAVGVKVSPAGLKSLGGWSSDEMPRRVYADQENKHGRKEAASVRASFRGEDQSE
jgi:integrase